MVLQEGRHRTYAGDAVTVSRETTPATGAPGVMCRCAVRYGRGGPIAGFSGASLLRLVIQCVRCALERTLEVLPMAIQAAVVDELRDEMSVVE
jgi:hypothetical protein